MPRSGKDFKMYNRILPSLELDITDLIENGQILHIYNLISFVMLLLLTILYIFQSPVNVPYVEHWLPMNVGTALDISMKYLIKFILDSVTTVLIV